MTADAEHEWVAIIGNRRIPTSAKVIEHYKRVFKELPVRFERAHTDAGGARMTPLPGTSRDAVCTVSPLLDEEGD